MDEPIVRVENLRKVFASRGRRGETVAVDGISFSVPGGRSLAIVGESGSGKTTTARMLLGLERPTAGTIHGSPKLLLESWFLVLSFSF